MKEHFSKDECFFQDSDPTHIASAAFSQILRIGLTPVSTYVE